jgi:hypothetical protein
MDIGGAAGMVEPVSVGCSGGAGWTEADGDGGYKGGNGVSAGAAPI